MSVMWTTGTARIKFCSNCGHSFVAKTAPQPVHAAAPRQQSSAPQAAPVTPHQPTPAAPTQQQPPTPQSASTVHAQPQSPASQPTREAHTQQQPPVPHPTPETVTPSSPARRNNRQHRNPVSRDRISAFLVAWARRKRTRNRQQMVLLNS